MVNAKENIADSEHQDKLENNSAQESCDIHEQILDEKRNLFIEELVQAGYDWELANKALDHVDPEDISEGKSGYTLGFVCCFEKYHENE